MRHTKEYRTALIHEKLSQPTRGSQRPNAVRIRASREAREALGAVLENLRVSRAEPGPMSKEELEEITGIKAKQLIHIESGASVPDGSSMRRILKAHGIVPEHEKYEHCMSLHKRAWELAPLNHRQTASRG